VLLLATSLPQGKIKGGGTGKVAIDHANRYKSDYKFMRQMGVNVHR
jgi:beta-glucosidase/6-phospho-beta-glucosidase/beta-galactosidase